MYLKFHTAIFLKTVINNSGRYAFERFMKKDIQNLSKLMKFPLHYKQKKMEFDARISIMLSEIFYERLNKSMIFPHLYDILWLKIM